MSSYKETRDALIKKYGVNTSKPSSDSKKSAYEEARDNLTEKYSYENTIQRKDSVTSWADKFRNTMNGISDYSKKRNGGYTTDAAGGFGKDVDDLINEYETIKPYADRLGLPNSKRYADELKRLRNSIQSENAFMSQFADEEAFNKWKQETEEYEALKNFDIKKGEAEVQDLEKVLNEYKALSRTMIDDKMQARLDYITENYGDEKGIKALIAEKKATMNRAKHIQEGITLAGVIENDDFKDKSGYVSTKTDGTWNKLTSQFGMGYDDLTYEYINGEENGMREEIIGKALSYDHDTEKFFSYDHMTEDQIATYNYYYAKDGKEAAEKYLDSIQETLNYQAASERYKKMEGKTALEMLFGIEAGVDQFQSGFKNVFNTEDDYIAQTAIQMASGMVREDLADNGVKLPDWLGGASLGQMGYDTITTSANMAPSILTSVAIGFINPVAGQWFGSAMMGASAAGNAYQEALNEGYSQEQARGYSILVGGSEMVMEKVLGGISAVGGNALGKLFTKNISNADTALKMIAKKLGGSILSEFSEEYLQEVLTPVFQNIAFGTDNEVKLFSPEALYSGILGALTAGIMEGPFAVGTEVKTHKTGKQLQAAGISATRLAEIGSTFSADTVAYQLAGKVDENTGAYTMGRLFNEIGATLSEQNVTEITEALIKEGIPEKLAKKKAKTMALIVDGATLTDEFIEAMDDDKILAKAVKATIIDPNATWFQRSKGYNEALMALAQEKTSQAKATKQSQENALATNTVGTQNNGAVQSLSEAETVDTSPAKVKTISSINNGQVTVKLEDGTEVNLKQADLSVDDGVRIDTIAKLDGISAADANFILNTLRTNTSTSAQMDSLGAREAYKYGYYGFSKEHMATHGVFANSLTDTQRQAIYQTGQNARAVQVAAQQAAVAKNATTSTKVTGKVHFEGDRSTLTERQNTSLTALERVADALGVQIYVFESKVNERGKRIGANGWYDPKDSSIHIDLHAGENGAGTMLFTAAHELTHHVRKWSPEKFKTLSDFLMQEYGKKGVNADALVREQMAKAERNKRHLSYDEAFEEVVADSMEMMLSDGNVMKRLEKLKAQDKDLWHKIKSFIDELAAKIKAVYKGMAPDSVEGRHVADMGKAIYRLQELFAEGLVDASENFQSAMENVVEADAKAVAEDEIITDGAVVTDGVGKKYSLRSMKQDIAEGQMFEDLKTHCGWTQKQVNELRNNLADLVEYMTPYRDILDMNETYGREGRRFSPYKPNSDPLYKISMDFSTLCSKRLLTQYVIENLQLRENRPMSAEEQMAIRAMLNEYRSVEKGLQVACAMCYVEAARLKSPKQITKWMEDPGTQMKNYFADKNPDFANFIKEKQADFKESRGYDRNATKKDMSPKDVRELNKIRPRLRSQYQLSAEEAQIIERVKSLPGSTYLTAGNLASLSETDPTIYAAYTAFVRTATRSKSLETDEPYYYGDSRRDNGNGIIVSDSFIEAVNRENGMRFSSWSDWRIQHLLDYITAVIDNSVRGAAMHGYTKFGEEVRVLGKTGMMFNMSGVAGTQTGLNEDGSLSFSPTESIDVNEAIQLREEFPDTAGLQCIGVGDDHIVALLRSDFIDYVIPYHVSGLNAGLRAMANIHGWKDYTSTQHAAVDKSIKFENAVDQEHWHEEPVYSEFFVGYDTGKTGIEAMRASADRYVQMCKDRGLKPKFEQFVKEDNYWKLLIDRKMVNQKTGKIIQQKPVTPTFDFDTVKSVVDQFVQNYDSGLEARALNHIVENWDSIPKRIRDLKKQGSTKAKKASKAVDTLANQTLAAQPAEIKRSDRDSDGNQLSKEQSAFFAQSKVRDDNGNLMVMYHGTANGGAFTVFDGDKLGNDTRTTQVGQGFYFTNMKAEAEAYTKNVDIYGRTSKGKNPHLHQVYLNITNPFNIDSDALNIDKVKSVYMDGTYDYFFSNWIPFYLKNKTLDGRTFTKAEVEAMSKADKVSVYVDYLAQIGTKEVLSNMVRAFPYGKQSELLTSMKNNLGYDGIVEEFKPGQYQYVAFSPEQVKATDNQNPTSNPDIRYSDRDTESVSNRSLLANAFEGVAQNDIERQKLQDYKGKIDLINSEERKLSELNEKIKDLSFAKGPKDTKAIRDLQFQAKQTANRISTYDKQLLTLEASKPLQNVLQREKKMAYQRAEKKGKEALEAYREKTMKTQRELIEKWQDSRKKGIESRQKTAMRHKIKDVVNELNQYLLRGTKDRHVPIELQKAVAEALDAVNMDTVGADERIAKLEAELLKAKTPEKIQEISRKIDHVREMGDRMNGRLRKLKDAYDQFVNSDDPMIANSHDEVISNKLQAVIESVGDTPLRDMSIAQLEDVYDMYRMVLTTIRNTNKAFKAKKSESISIIANQVMAEVEKVGGKKKLSLKGTEGIKGFFWNNLKPVYAFEHIGSDHFTEVFNNVRAGEDVWAVDVTEAREFYLEKSKKHGYDSWDFKKRYKFTSSSGMDFDLSLEQIMSLYAYSKREQAADHLKRGGIVIDETTEITMKNKLGIPVKFNPTEATAYNISDATLAEIISKLTADQKDFVDVMQDYLSTVMGAKGNEVSLEMYGVKLFKEKFYFPLKSAQQFMAKAKEQQKGEVKIKNSGFSKETVQKASNPIVLTPFMNVWADHVNEMSMYHAFVLPMEDFYRVYNYKTPTSDTMATESVEMFIQNAYGKGATKYIDQLLKDLNGGARTDHTTGIINKMMGLFKKGAVFASLSVVVQQPSAIARAAALVDTKYFIGPKVDHKRHAALWDEVKQYAPVAVIKEMGYFDTNMGKSTQDFILGKEHSGFKDKMKALVTDSGYRDEVLSKAPALADEIAWCSIWEAVKRETKSNYPGLDTKGEPFLKLAGSRFTEVIVKTQVYDSVLSRSGLMRSKDTGMKMATAFMAEPTTSINMITDALLKGKRGNKKYARGAIGAVIASQILNSILVSFVYAGRDDDEDETYAEKYIGTLTGEILDSLNPAGYIPFIKDIQSIVQGYDVERSDMAVISDLWKAWENLSKDYISPYRKVEGFAGSIAQIFGLPVKNIMRDARGIYQTIDSFVNGQQTTKAGVGYAVKGAITGKTVTNDQQLYEAILSGDQAQIARVKSRYDDASAVNSAIRKGLRENDSRIYEAALAQINGHPEERVKLQRQVIADGFTQDDVVIATNTIINNLSPSAGTSEPKKKGLYTTEDFALFVAGGNSSLANEAKKDIIATNQLNGKTAYEAEKSFQSSAKTDLKDMLIAGTVTVAVAEHALKTYCGMDAGEAKTKVNEWNYFKTTGVDYSDKREQFLAGEMSASDLVKALVSVEGKTEEEAAKTVVSYTRDAYEDGLYDRSKAADVMVTYGGLTDEEAEAKLRYIDVKKQFPDTFVDDAWVDEYYAEVESSGIPVEVFVDYRNQVKSITGDGKKERRMAVINSMPISNAQKDALYYAEGWAASKLYEAPWR